MLATPRSETERRYGEDADALPSSGLHTVLYRSRDGLAHDQVNDVAVDGGGVVWVATENGVSRFDPTTGLFTNQRHTDWGTTSSAVQAIYIAPDGTKWFGTEQGVVRYVGT